MTYQYGNEKEAPPAAGGGNNEPEEGYQTARGIMSATVEWRAQTEGLFADGVYKAHVSALEDDSFIGERNLNNNGDVILATDNDKDNTRGDHQRSANVYNSTGNVATRFFGQGRSRGLDTGYVPHTVHEFTSNGMPVSTQEERQILHSGNLLKNVFLNKDPTDGGAWVKGRSSMDDWQIAKNEYVLKHNKSNFYNAKKQAGARLQMFEPDDDDRDDTVSGAFFHPFLVPFKSGLLRNSPIKRVFRVKKSTKRVT